MQLTKGGNSSKYTCELYIMNWSYSKKLGIVFAMYQIVRLKGASWYGPRLISTGKKVYRPPLPYIYKETELSEDLNDGI